MNKEQKELLIEQANKIEEVINTLSSNFNEEDIADEVNFLHIVSELLTYSKRELKAMG